MNNIRVKKLHESKLFAFSEYMCSAKILPEIRKLAWYLKPYMRIFKTSYESNNQQTSEKLEFKWKKQQLQWLTWESISWYECNIFIRM